MCGIFCCIPKYSKSSEKCPTYSEHKLFTILKNRGPNSQGEVFLTTNGLTFAGFVLWQQGSNLCPQPVQLTANNFILLFNGDIFNIHDFQVDNCQDLEYTSKISDTEWLANELEKCLTAMRSKDDLDGVLELFCRLEGPYSCVFYIERWQTIFFLRDAMGRNSLLLEYDLKLEHFHLLSTTVMTNIEHKKVIEIPPIGLYRLSLNNSIENWSVIPWQQTNPVIQTQIENLSQLIGIKIHCEMDRNINPNWLTRIPLSSKIPTFNFYELCKSFNQYKSTEEFYEYLLRNEAILKTIGELSRLLERSVRDRVQFIQKSCTNCLQSTIHEICKHSKIAILFSGGLDCSILAYLCDKYIHPEDSIDLINVAFENTKNIDTSSHWQDNVPDRLTSRATFESLKTLCSSRVWNYIEVNVRRQELKEQLSTHLKHLIYPLNTVLDESIGSAFWFAARGLTTKKNSVKVIILGTGADELFGGYIRHRNAFKHCPGDIAQKLIRVLDELDFDWQRLPFRNLARDDRCISDTGRTPRTPFLEEHFTQFIRSLSPEQRCCFTLPLGVGDKLLLRLYAYSIGLKSASILPKRAIQFGSRIADSKQNAKDPSFYLN